MSTRISLPNIFTASTDEVEALLGRDVGFRVGFFLGVMERVEFRVKVSDLAFKVLFYAGEEPWVATDVSSLPLAAFSL